jgi:hypothetical protein
VNDAAHEPLEAAEREQYVFAIMPRCPYCDGVRHRSYRSIDQGDGSRKKWTRCECGKKFIIVLE